MNDALVGTAEQRVTMVRLLLQLGCKAKDYPDWLVWAASSGEMQLMLLLLGNGADPNVADRRLRMLPLAVATWCDVIRQNGGACIDITRVLMRFGADPNREPPADETWPPHREASPIVAAGSSGKVDQVQLLIDNGADVNKLDAGGMSPLGAALLSEVRREKSPLAGQDGVSVITLLLKHGADPNFEYPDSSSDVPDVEGKTLLTLAADRNLYAVTKLLLQYGANPRKRDAEGWCADERAVGTGNPKLLKLLARWLKDSR